MRNLTLNIQTLSDKIKNVGKNCVCVKICVLIFLFYPLKSKVLSKPNKIYRKPLSKLKYSVLFYQRRQHTQKKSLLLRF